jgi:hypothetical protein
MALFDTLGFQWNRDSVPREIPRASLKRVVFRFHRMLPEYVWDAGVLEGNPFTFPEVKSEQPTRAFSFEETRREARENWRRNYREKSQWHHGSLQKD